MRAKFLQRLESRLDTLETKLATSEQSLIQKTSERLAATLPYANQIAQLQQNIGIIAQTLQAEIMQKVTTLLTENVDLLLPDLPKIRENIDTVTKEMGAQKGGG